MNKPELECNQTGGSGETVYQLPDPGGMEMVLNVYITDYGLDGASRANMVSHFFMTVKTELIHRDNGKRYYGQKYKYKSALRPVSEWITDEGKNLQNEYNKACHHFGNLLFGEYFGNEIAGLQ